MNLSRDMQGALVAIGTALIMFLFLLVISASASKQATSGGSLAGGLLFGVVVFIIIGGIIWALRKAGRGGPPGATGSDNAPNNSLPPLSLLQRPKPAKKGTSFHQKKAQLIEQTLLQFEVPAKVVAINQGPRLTQFGIEPGVIETAKRDGTVKRRKVKVNAITALADDLSLALGASVRTVMVSGASYVGLEVPNDEAQSVFLADVPIEGKGGLPVALGLDVAGQPVEIDITNMPHVLIAGATGSGKSACANALIASLLMRFTPHELNLLMIDPKMVELVQYEGLPHLVAPVITDMEQAAGALRWAVAEMERRYQRLKKARKRNIVSYNSWAKANGEPTLPYLVIVIDELADLMIQYQEEVEPLIVRLAQLARATGLHLILATQRPSVDVVTGLIKANVPTRIAFAVASSTDSRVILDRVGAETLLGRGDMLHLASDATHARRIQGCFVSDEELDALIEHWRNSASSGASDSAFGSASDSAFLLDDRDDSASDSASGSTNSAADNSAHSDELLPAAIALLQQHDSVSTTFLQRQLRISYTCAARLIDTLKERGLIESADDSPPRQSSPPIHSPAANETYEQRIAELEAQLAATESGLSWNEVWPVVASLFREVPQLPRVNMKTTKAAARALGATIGRDVWQKGTWRDITAAFTVYASAIPDSTPPSAPETAENEAVNA